MENTDEEEDDCSTCVMGEDTIQWNSREEYLIQPQCGGGSEEGEGYQRKLQEIATLRFKYVKFRPS